jgi:hypothetical protein
MVRWLCSLINKTGRKMMTIGVGFFLMYAGFIMLLLPMIISTEPLSLSNDPQSFGFEDDLNSISSIDGTPTVVTSPFASGRKAIECQNGDYVRWDLATPSKTIDLTFKIYWTKFPTIANESLFVGEIFGSDTGMWQDIFSTSLYCNPQGYRGWSLWTGIPDGRVSFVSSDVVYALETKRWYTIRMTADLNKGTHEVYMDGTELASITDVLVPADVYVDFFRLGAGAQGDSIFITYYDDVTASFLGPSPPPQQWSVRITSSSGGSTNPYGTINVNYGENLTVNATQAMGYVFSMWTLDGADYNKSSMVTVPAQSSGTRHTLHAIFTSTSPEPSPEHNWLPFQVIGLGMTLSGGYVLWSQKKRKSTNIARNIETYNRIFVNLGH